MKNMIKFDTIAQVHAALGLAKPKHPLISLVRLGENTVKVNVENLRYCFNLYQISLKGNCPFTIRHYGRQSYDFQEGTMVFIAPNQVLEFEKKAYSENSDGWTLLIHPDFLRKSKLGEQIKHYSFFDYATYEALHLSYDEQQIVTDITQKIESEYNGNIDAHSQILIISNIELLLNYCTRFYDRQFYTRSHVNKDIVAKFEQLLKSYYQSDQPYEKGMPTVQYCGKALNISPKYLSDLLRKETGQSTQDHIHDFIIERAKNILLNSHIGVSEIAYKLGFSYPQYFSKIFKKHVQMSPSEFRQHNINH